MMHFTITEYIVFVGALVVAFLALRSHIPSWALFTINVVFALYWLVSILDSAAHREMDGRPGRDAVGTRASRRPGGLCAASRRAIPSPG